MDEDIRDRFKGSADAGPAQAPAPTATNIPQPVNPESPQTAASPAPEASPLATPPVSNQMPGAAPTPQPVVGKKSKNFMIIVVVAVVVLVGAILWLMLG